MRATKSDDAPAGRWGRRRRLALALISLVASVFALELGLRLLLSSDLDAARRFKRPALFARASSRWETS